MVGRDLEIWKDVSGYEGIYQISNHGRVRSLPRLIKIGINSFKYVDLKILRQNRRNHYYSVNLYKPGEQTKTLMIHRMVAIHFKRSPRNPEKNIVNHKDCNKLNNHHSNLEWVTHTGNCRHARNNGRIKVPFTRGENNGRSILTESKVLEMISFFGKKNNVQISKIFGVSKNTVLDIKSGRTWKHLKQGSS